MNVEIGTEKEFPEKEYINGIFLAVYAPCTPTPCSHPQGLIRGIKLQ
jgi:hypothetical protein